MTNTIDWTQCAALVVEDSRVQRNEAVSLLRQIGFARVYEAENGVEAMKMIEAVGIIDLILTDLDMPSMDGVELLENMIYRGFKSPYVIIASARDQSIMGAVENLAEAAEIKLLGSLPKPLSIDALLGLLGNAQPPSTKRGSRELPPEYSLSEVREAIKLGQIIPYYQPKVGIGDGIMRGVEALARWQHPLHGLVPPMLFIPVIERSDLNDEFFLYMLQRVAMQMAKFQAKGLRWKAAVNLSAQSLSTPDITDRAVTVCQAEGIQPSQIVLEVTETMVMAHLSRSIGNLAKMRLRGFGLSMDDYGTGYSSMKQLSRCPFTELKIDRSFVDRAADKPNLSAILASAVEMAAKLNLSSVGEGVERIEDMRVLCEVGCDVAQGYLVARPMPGEVLLDWFKEHRDRFREEWQLSKPSDSCG